MTDLDQAEINAREILELEKTGKFQELKNERIRCSCKAETGRLGPIIARFFTGPEDTSGEVVGWARVPACKVSGEKVPATATTIPLKKGEAGWTLLAQCGKCRTTWALFPAGVSAEIAGKWATFSYREKSASEPWQIAERVSTGQFTAERINGPGPVVLVRIASPDWGEIDPPK